MKPCYLYKLAGRTDMWFLFHLPIKALSMSCHLLKFSSVPFNSVLGFLHISLFLPSLFLNFKFFGFEWGISFY